MKTPTNAQLKQLQRDNARYPQTLVEIPMNEWPSEREGARSGDKMVGAWRSRRFLVMLFAQRRGPIMRLSVNRTDWNERTKRFHDQITWDDLQRLKSEAGYSDQCAIEVFPPDSLIVNVANMRHLFLLPVVPNFVWGQGE